jgi:hypothetical protein
LVWESLFPPHPPLPLPSLLLIDLLGQILNTMSNNGQCHDPQHHNVHTLIKKHIFSSYPSWLIGCFLLMKCPFWLKVHCINGHYSIE